jgi:hypothetical protein
MTSPDWTNTPAQPSPPPKKRRGGGLTIFIAVLALLFSLVSAVLSWHAAGRASSTAGKVDTLIAAQKALPPPPPAPVTPAAPTGQPVDTSTAAPPPGSVPTLDAQTQYKVKYTNQSLRIAAGCGQNIDIDLDEPRVQAASQVSELTYYDACGPQTATIDLKNGVQGSEVGSEFVTPVECAEQIRTSPLSRESHPVRRGQVYCIETSLGDATSSAITWKMVLLEISAMAEDGAVTLKSSAWDIPT